MNPRSLLALGLVIGLISSLAMAREFRQMRPIATPQSQSSRITDGFEAPSYAVSAETVRDGLQWILGDWNTRALAEHIGEQFYDGNRLLDILDTAVPRDARLRLLSVRDFQVIGQRVERDASGKASMLVSQVNVVAETQIEFNDPVSGLRRLEGTNEFLLELTESFGSR